LKAAEAKNRQGSYQVSSENGYSKTSTIAKRQNPKKKESTEILDFQPIGATIYRPLRVYQ
jgi:hypothetical protein